LKHWREKQGSSPWPIFLIKGVGSWMLFGLLCKYYEIVHHTNNTSIKMTSKIAIITGASAGIGKAAAERLAKDFTGLVLVARRENELIETAKSLQEHGVEILVIPIDLKLPPSVDRVISETMEKFGRIDALVNNAGAVPQINLFEMTDQEWNDGAEMKLHGARRLTIAAWPILMENKGSVVFMSGSAAEAPKAKFAAVSTINAAINALAKAFADQGIEDGVQVNSISPGAVMTSRRIGFLSKFADSHNISINAGWLNEHNSWEVRNRYFKGCTGHKGITYIPGHPKKAALFEGFIDFLSWRLENREADHSIIVLNSINLLQQGIKKAMTFSSLDIYFDRDKGGITATRDFIKALPYASDRSAVYAGFNDYNHKIKSQLKLPVSDEGKKNNFFANVRVPFSR
ncbi:MAG TPA: SDR family NAD(P)-dependent oxidoreductase, partial [Mucilaginibacter sp.]|jgi:3-oxoacyl-[acyl-carrier protein] reductase